VENREFLEIIYGAVDQCQCARAERGEKNNGRQPPWGAAIPGRHWVSPNYWV